MKQIQQSLQQFPVLEIQPGIVSLNQQQHGVRSGVYILADLIAPRLAAAGLWTGASTTTTSRARRTARKPAAAAQVAAPNYQPIQRAQRRGRGRPKGSRNLNRQTTAMTQGTSPQ